MFSTNFICSWNVLSNFGNIFLICRIIFITIYLINFRNFLNRIYSFLLVVRSLSQKSLDIIWNLTMIISHIWGCCKFEVLVIFATHLFIFHIKIHDLFLIQIKWENMYDCFYCQNYSIQFFFSHTIPESVLKYHINLCLRPYHGEYTASRPICQVKHHWARIVLRTETAWEHRVL